MATPTFTDLSVTLSHSGKLATITLQREKTLNSLLQRSTYPQLLRALRYVDSIDSVVVTVITGAGRFFSSGQDLRDAGSESATRSKLERTVAQADNDGMLWAGPGGASIGLIEHKKITVVALNGPVVGWPAAWVPAADLIVAADSAYVYMPFVHIGAMIEASGSYSWAWRVGGGLASDMILTGRRVTAQELYNAGGVQRVWPTASFQVELGKFIEDLAERCNPNTLLEAKGLIRNPITKMLMQTAVVNEQYNQIHRRSNDSASGFAKRLAEIEAKKKEKL